MLDLPESLLEVLLVLRGLTLNQDQILMKLYCHNFWVMIRGMIPSIKMK